MKVKGLELTIWFNSCRQILSKMNAALYEYAATKRALMRLRSNIQYVKFCKAGSGNRADNCLPILIITRLRNIDEDRLLDSFS